MKLYKIFFSPTGGTKKVIDFLAAGWDCETEEIDLMGLKSIPGTYTLTSEDICLLAVPAFGGRVPEPAAEVISRMEGSGAKCVLVAVYGNRAFEDTLVELKNIASKAGFLCKAAVAAVAEHSIVHRFGEGRPDREDMQVLKGFGQQICKMFKEQKDRCEVEVPGNNPFRPYSVLPLRPETSESCTECGICASQCPVGAIPESEPSAAAGEKCISCMHCVAVCPEKARFVNSERVGRIEKKIEKACADRKVNELFLACK